VPEGAAAAAAGSGAELVPVASLADAVGWLRAHAHAPSRSRVRTPVDDG